MTHCLMVAVLASGYYSFVLASDKDNGKNNSPEAWKGWILIKQNVPMFIIGNKMLRVVSSEKADQNAKAFLDDLSKLNASLDIKSATVTGSIQKDKNGAEFIMIDTLRLEDGKADTEKKNNSLNTTPSAGGIVVESASFKSGQAIPARFSGEGTDLSPALAWKGVPAEAKEIAVVVDDPDAPDEVFVHWLVWNIPPTATNLQEGSSKFDKSIKQGQNDFGNSTYNGPLPPKGHGVHHYRFKVFALKAPLALPAGANKMQVLAKLKDLILSQGEYVGTFERK